MFHHRPNFTLGENVISKVEALEIVGVSFTLNGNFIIQAQPRIVKCCNSLFAMSDADMCYPGLTSDTKSYLLKPIYHLTLLYGLESVPSGNAIIKQFENMRGSIMKRVCVAY